NAVQWVGASNQPVEFSFNLDLANTTATLLPLNPLDPGTRFTVMLSSNITDTLGRNLVGSNQFVFNTVALPTRDPAAQLIIYEPGATNVPATVLTNIPGYLPGTNRTSVVIQGTGGSADPGVPVIVVNENSGETTTVLAKKDGSFAALLSGSEQDFISATFISLNGARVYVPVNRQLFDNGFVGLYRQGGTLQVAGENGPIQVVIPPNGVETRTKFKLSSLSTNDLQGEVDGVNPSGATVAGGALRMQIDGPAPTLPMRLSFPVDLAQLGFPTNEVPTNAAAVATVVQDTQDVKTYQVVDQLLFRPTPRGFLAKGHRPKDEQLFYGVLESALGFSGAGFAAQTALNFVVVPLLIGPRAVVIKGYTESIPSELSQAIDAGQLPAGFVPGANATLDYLKRQVSTPLSGAFIILRQLANADIGQPGRLQPGMVYATSGADGSYLMIAPSLLDIYILTATHPQFDDKQSEPIYGPAQLSLAGVIFKDFFFEKPAVIQAPPNLNIANAPQWPAPGQDCLVEVNASHALGAPRISVGIQAVNSLVGGVPVTIGDATLQNQNLVTAGKTTQWTGTIHSDKSVQVILKVAVQAANGFGTFTSYAVDFSGFTLPSTNQPIPRPDTNDVHGPLVVSTDPPNNGFLGTDDQISIFFNKPIDSYVNDHPEGITLGDSAVSVTPIIRLSPGQGVLQIQFPGLPAGQTFRLTLSG
ncbi:MAG TPA: Ig-like domain-containing protein, partial [Verrucomicrobiae bacterium]|nr:Ig-like domain-containing protein [Verrucomicrobiae bacterium]